MSWSEAYTSVLLLRCSCLWLRQSAHPAVQVATCMHARMQATMASSSLHCRIGRMASSESGVLTPGCSCMAAYPEHALTGAVMQDVGSACGQTYYSCFGLLALSV